MQIVEQNAVRRHESLARRGNCPRLDVARFEQRGNVGARDTAGAAIVGKKPRGIVFYIALSASASFDLNSSSPLFDA